MKITETMDRSKAIEVGEFSIMPCTDYPDGSKSVWIEEASGEGGQFPQETFGEAIREYYDKNF